MSTPTPPFNSEDPGTDSGQWAPPSSVPQGPDSWTAPEAGRRPDAQTTDPGADPAQAAPASGWETAPPWNAGPGWSSPGWGDAGPGPAPAPQPAAGWMPPPQPGVIPLRPLSIGDLFEATFRTIRANPSVMFGFSVAVMAIASLITSVIEASTASQWIGLVDDPQAALAGDDLTGLAGQIAGTLTSSAASGIITALVTMVLSGMLALTVSDATLGAVTPLGAAWARVRPHLLPLIGVTVLNGLIGVAAFGVIAGIFAIPFIASLAGSGGADPSVAGVLLLLLGLLAGAAASLFFQVRLLFGPTIIVLEDLGPVQAIRRSWSLTSSSFWRILGRMILIALLTAAATFFVAGAVGLVGGLITLLASEFVGTIVTGFLSGVVSGFIIPISAAFTTLMYVDERIRQENLAPALAEAAQASRAAR
ncbi:MAG: glycerophosphoryl diester phosphodiesterase membrane domain-containing protein [Actinomyces sp.]|nr:glycerophosphoryl diester phosphodiesterase membrane domain-containing protein [Actinomyces sp.]MCI1640906.1 glycerophosphoryl diester phosphodiesterase membrane domain-containing protein [Actinomyces sp.]MCI1661274.1 glycerophosphoryl diester phosphodiesterase membrane domain-containing protein [Actinomyces sp.]MCI1829511.1 glycerophosphoryl diester phosphodiesterase membrane domain-containing protein [Actinomyces sp.]